MCTYNGEKYIKEQLDSILKQSHPVDEIIIQDDCSTDGTLKIIQKYEQKEVSIKCFQNERNLGYNANFISALQKATGDYIAISDQDDIWHPDKIALQLKEMNNCLLCFHNTKIFSSDGSPINQELPETIEPNHNLEYLIFFNSISGHTIMMKKQLLKLIPHLEDFSCFYRYWVYDQILAIVAESFGQISFIHKNLAFHRRLATSATYKKPPKYLHTFFSSLAYIYSSMVVYVRKRNIMSDYFLRMHKLLDELPGSRSFSAKSLCRLQMERSFLNYVRFTSECIRLRNRIFISFNKKGSKKLINLGRMILFPIFVSNSINEK